MGIDVTDKTQNGFTLNLALKRASLILASGINVILNLHKSLFV